MPKLKEIKDKLNKAWDELSNAEASIAKTNKILKKGQEVQEALNKAYSNNWADTLLAIPTLGGLGISLYFGKWAIGKVTNMGPSSVSESAAKIENMPNSNSNSTTNITINNITKIIEDI